MQWTCPDLVTAVDIFDHNKKGVEIFYNSETQTE